MSARTPTTVRFEAAVPQFTVPDVSRAAEYYRDILGFQIAGYWDGERVSLTTDPPPVFGIVRRDHVQVFFNRADRPDVRTGRAQGGYDAYLRVTGIDALAEELRTRGADILEGPEDRVYGERELVVRDGNGLILVFGDHTGRGATGPTAAPGSSFSNWRARVTAPTAGRPCGDFRGGHLSAVLRASGPNFDVDAFTRDCRWPIARVFRRDEPRSPRSPRTPPDGRKLQESGLNVVVSEADFDDFASQLTDAIAFLTEFGPEVRRLAGFPGVTGVVLDFGIAPRDVVAQYDAIPAELVRLAGACGIGLELSHYLVGDDGRAAGE